MDHSEALKTRAAERYLLNELAGDEKSAFEEHYFSCQECAEEVRYGAILAENLRQSAGNLSISEFGEHRIRARRGFWSKPFLPGLATAAVILLGTTVGYQNLVTIPRLRQEVSVEVPQALTSVSLMPSVSRGEGLPKVQVGPQEPFGLYLDIPPHPEFNAFRCEVRSGSNVEFAIRISNKQANDTVHLLIPGGKLAAGRYDLVVSGIPSSASSTGLEIVRYSFEVEHPS